MKFLSKLLETFPWLVESSLREIAEVVKDKAQKTVLFKGGPNSPLRQAIKIKDISSNEKSVIADKPYAQFVEDGNDQKGPFIYPTNSRALHFYVNGQEVFAKKVRSHKALPFMKNAEKETIPLIEGIISKHISNWIK